MFKVIQSNQLYALADRLVDEYTRQTEVFDEFVVITPAKVLEDWLIKYLAKKTGIGTLFSTQFWGQYQWQLIADVLNTQKDWLIKNNQGNQALGVPEVAVLSGLVVHWRIFDFFAKPINQNQSFADTIVNDESHELYFLLANLVQPTDSHKVVDKQKLWRLCQELANLYVKYLTQRPEWLTAWANGRAVNVKKMIADKDAFAKKMATTLGGVSDHQNNNQSDNQSNNQNDTNDYATPAWLVEHYEKLETALRTIWHTLFADVYHYRERLEGGYRRPTNYQDESWQGLQPRRLGGRFWEVLAAAHSNPDDELSLAIKAVLPKTLYLFTVQQLPPVELNFLKQLSLYVDVILFHHNPSQMYWADIVDERYLLNQQIYNPMSVYAKDYGQALLSRLGKTSRDTFAMLASMAGGDDYQGFVTDWNESYFEGFDNRPPSVLNQLKTDILNLEKTGVANALQLAGADDSLVVHSCHSLKRQLEVARAWIGAWLNQPSFDGSIRSLSDIAIMLPDVEQYQASIRAAFGEQVGLDGLVLPAKLTGVSNQAVAQMWQAVVGFYELPSGRFYADALYAWLSLPSVYENFGLSFGQMSRACELLTQAGFVRGLDGTHLQAQLDRHDTDFRHSFANALDRLVLSLSFDGQERGSGAVAALYPFVLIGELPYEKTPIMPQVTAEDEPIIAALCRIYAGFDECRNLYNQSDEVITWLIKIENELIDRYFVVSRHTEAMRAIFDAKNQLQKSIIANAHYHKYSHTAQNTTHKTAIRLPLSFVLTTLGEKVLAQQISSEPSGVMSVGRLGSLRNIPFKLVIMLGMNASAFPKKETHSRLDLMRAGKPMLGDRQSEDDDNGAFLDAILSAQENCWIFYDGQSLTDTPKLPATPVKELIKFILNTAPNKTDEPMRPFVREYPALPFDESLFFGHQASEYPPAPIWQGVRSAMHQFGKPAPRFVLPSETALVSLAHDLAAFDKSDVPSVVWQTIDDGKITTLDGLLSVLKNPAKAYLSNLAKVYVPQDEKKPNEPLALESLAKFSLNQSLLMDDAFGTNTADFAHNYFANIEKLPYGAARFGVLNLATTQMQSLAKMIEKPLLLLGDFDVWQILKTPKKLNQVKLTPTLAISATLPKKELAIWATIRPSKVQNHHLLSAFLSHLIWQIWRDDNDNPNAGISVWQFLADKKNPKTFLFMPIPKLLATQTLIKFLYVANYIKQSPILIDPKVGIDYVFEQLNDNLSDTSDIFKCWKKSKSEFSYHYDGLNDDYWAYLLDGYDENQVLSELQKSVSAISPFLYTVFWQYLYQYDEENNTIVQHLNAKQAKSNKKKSKTQ